MLTDPIVFPIAVQRAAVLSLHTSPLAQPGSGDSGGMNVYVRELVSGLAQAGVDCTTFTRMTDPSAPTVIQVEPGHRVVHVPAGPFDLDKSDLEQTLQPFGDAVLDMIKNDFPADVVHANYWLSGVVGHRLKHELGLPLVTTFHTLGMVKAEGGDPEPERRHRAEREIIGCSDAICVSCTAEEAQFRRLYGDPPGRMEIVAPGVEHAFFAPGDQRGARTALGIPLDVPVLLFCGRIQPLKGPDLAVRALAALQRSDAQLLIVGGASGAEGARTVAELHALIDELGVCAQVHFVDPQPHHILSTYYRAADVVVIPSRSESFGLVALEASACGVPVVASAVGGLLTLVDHGETGYLVTERNPVLYADYIARIIDNPIDAAVMSERAAARAKRYTWGFAAARLRRVYADLIGAQRLVACS